MRFSGALYFLASILAMSVPAKAEECSGMRLTRDEIHHCAVVSQGLQFFTSPMQVLFSNDKWQYYIRQEKEGCLIRIKFHAVIDEESIDESNIYCFIDHGTLNSCREEEVSCRSAIRPLHRFELPAIEKR